MSRETPNKLAEVAEGVYRAGGIMVVLAVIIMLSQTFSIIAALTSGAILGVTIGLVLGSFGVGLLALYFVGKKIKKSRT